MNRWFTIVTIVGFAGYMLTGDLTMALIATGVLIAIAGAITAVPPRRQRFGKRWSWGGGLFIPPFYVGAHRRGDNQDQDAS